MKLKIVSHGQTEYDYLDQIQGRSNISLNDEGRREVGKLKYKIKDEKFDICFSSPLIRTVESAMILVGDRVEIKIDDRLIERDFGKIEGKYFKEYAIEKYWDYNLNLNDNKVETVEDVIKRVKEFINYLNENYSDKYILIVTHYSILRVINHILKDINLYNVTKGNCYIENIEY